MADEQATARSINEALGMATALAALIASSPGMTPEIIQAARGLVGSLAPNPAPGSPIGSAPPHFAKALLDKVAANLKSA